MRRAWEMGLLGALLLALPAHALTNTWQGGNNGQWNTNGNWSLNRPPIATDDVVIDNPRNIRLTNGPSAVAGTLTIRNVTSNFNFNSNGGRTLTVSGNVTLTNTGNATLNVPLSTTLGNLSKSGTGAITLNRTVVVNGAFDVTAGTLTLGSTLTANSIGVSGGTLNAQGNVTSIGAVTVSGGGTLAFQNAATLSAASLALASGSTLSLNFSSTTTVTLLTVSGNATVAGTLSLTGSTPSLAGSPYHLVRSTGGSIDFTGLSLGTVPGGLTFGFRVLGTDLVMDVTQNPVAIDAVTSATGTCGAGTLSWQHTVGATTNDRLLVIGVSTGSSTVSALPTSVTYAGQTLTARGGDNVGTTQVQIYTLTAPPRGTNTVTLTFPGGSSCFIVAGAVSYTGVNQGGPIGAVVSDTETGNTPLLATVTVNNLQLHDKVFGVLSSNTATSATPVQSNVTARWSALNGTEYGTAETLPYTGPANGSATLSYNMGPPTSQFWSMAVLPIHAANPNAAMELAPEVRTWGSSAVLSWRLGPSSDVVGFRVWREVSGRRELLTPGLVAGPILISRAALLAGSEPGWVDARTVPGATYLVESLHRNGSIRWTAATHAPGKPVLPSAELIAGSTSSLIDQRSPMRIDAADRVPSGATRGLPELQWRLAASNAVKLVVGQPGVVKVPAESLFAAGLPVGTPASSIKLYREGRPVARSVLAADGQTLHPGDAVEFYGYGMDTRYSGRAVYWLMAGPGTGTDIATVPAGSGDPSVATFLAASEIRERLTWFGAAQNGDAEKFFGPAVFIQPRQRTFTLDGLDLGGVGARLEVALQGLTDVAHSVSLAVNGLPVGTLDFQGAVPGSASFELPPGALVPGDNVVQLVSGAPEDVSLEQYVRIVYPRQTLRGPGTLDFTLPGGTATRLDGFDLAHTHVLDVTNPDTPVRLEIWDSSGTAAVGAPGTGLRHLVAYLDSDAAAPASVLPNHPSSWHSFDGADLVILGPSSLFGAVQPLVDRRRSEGLRVALVDIEDLQDEFASGEKSVEAVRGFLLHALQSWRFVPRYLLLLGSGSYDPRDYLGLGGDLVPSAVVQTDSQESVSDSWFVGLPGAPAVSVGRLPVRSVAETEAVVAKILGRREVDGHSPILLVSDALGTSDFPEMTADLRAALPDSPATVIIRGSDPDEVLHQRFVDAARGGPALVNYTGHGSELFWAGNLHTVADTDALAGGGTSLFIHMTCLTGFFQDPRRQSLAVATLVSPSGGAWGAWASTSLTYPTDHPALNRALARALLLEGKTLGEATQEALAGVSDPDLQATFVLLGDPSSRAVATRTAALQVGPASALGCRSTGGVWNFAALLAVVAWLAARQRRVAIRSRRRD